MFNTLRFLFGGWHVENNTAYILQKFDQNSDSSQILGKFKLCNVKLDCSELNASIKSFDALYDGKTRTFLTEYGNLFIFERWQNILCCTSRQQARIQQEMYFSDELVFFIFYNLFYDNHLRFAGTCHFFCSLEALQLSCSLEFPNLLLWALKGMTSNVSMRPLP